MGVKPLRIALVRQRYAADGGAEKFVARAMDTLRDRNVGLTLLARRWQGSPGVQVIKCDPFFIGSLWRDWSFARCVCRALRAQDIDLVQSHERVACCDIYRAGDGVHREWLAQRARALGPLGKLGLALSPYHIYVRGAERRLFESPRLKAVICNSRMVREEILRDFRIAPERLRVIYSGVDTNAYHPDLRHARQEIRARHGIPENAPLFLFVGSGFERKGVGTLLRAMAALPGDCYALIVGRDKRLRHYVAQANTLGLHGRAIFTGPLPDTRPYYGAADALVLPTLYDPFPNVALEAFASGLPVVTSTKCGAAELIENGRNGFTCDALDHAALAGCLRQLLAANRADMSRAARATAEGMSLPAMSEALLHLYEEVMRA